MTASNSERTAEMNSTERRALADGGDPTDAHTDDDASGEGTASEFVESGDGGASDEAASTPAGGDDETGVAEAPSESAGVPGDLLYETTPTIKPTLLLMGLTFLVGVAIEGYLLSNPEAVGGRDTMEVLLYVVAFVLAVALVRFLVRMLILERTTYQITDEVVRREYKLLFRHLSREVPLEHLKAHELRRNRIQALLGYGTVRFLTGGTNESLGFVEFENLLDPVEVRGIIRDVLP